VFVRLEFECGQLSLSCLSQHDSNTHPNPSSPCIPPVVPRRAHRDCVALCCLCTYALTLARPTAQVYDPDRLEEMLEASTTEFCTRHVEVQWLGDRPSPDFAAWSVAELKSFLEREAIDLSKMREKSELRDACRGTLPFAPNGQLARCVAPRPWSLPAALCTLGLSPRGETPFSPRAEMPDFHRRRVAHHSL
jgi:hypothetical protein